MYFGNKFWLILSGYDQNIFEDGKKNAYMKLNLDLYLFDIER